ncbi:hypothetical protein SDJN02_13239, partial [Cucurbita argyrosperma subsp. argyrosperma]
MVFVESKLTEESEHTEAFEANGGRSTKEKHKMIHLCSLQAFANSSSLSMKQEIEHSTLFMLKNVLLNLPVVDSVMIIKRNILASDSDNVNPAKEELKNREDDGRTHNLIECQAVDALLERAPAANKRFLREN